MKRTLVAAACGIAVWVFSLLFSGGISTADVPNSNSEPTAIRSDRSEPVGWVFGRLVGVTVGVPQPFSSGIPGR